MHIHIYIYIYIYIYISQQTTIHLSKHTNKPTINPNNKQTNKQQFMGLNDSMRIKHKSEKWAMASPGDHPCFGETAYGKVALPVTGVGAGV